MSLETDLMQPERAEETPPPEPAKAEPAAPVDEEAALDAELEAQAIDIPDGEKLVPLSAVTGVRGKLKETKAEAAAAKAEAERIRQEADQVRRMLDEARPWIESAKALAEAKGVGQPQAQPELKPQDDPELMELARTLDLYQADGTPDAAKAAKLMALVDKRAEAKADAKVAPYQQHTLQQQAAVTLARAKATEVNGVKADPAILDALWQRTDPSVAANPEAAKWLLATAIGLTSLGGQQPAQAPAQGRPRGADGKFQPQTPPDPLYTEKAGGRMDADLPPLSAAEQKIARELFGRDNPNAEREYLKHAASMPKGWGKGR